MSNNLAAIIPAAKTPLEVRSVDTPAPGPHELLIKTEVIAFNPIEFKVAKLGIFPLEYPIILGNTSAGTIEAVGSEVTEFSVGDKVVALQYANGQYGSYQRYVLVGKDVVVSKVPKDGDLKVLASLIMNLTSVVGMFSGRIGLERPSLDGVVAAKDASKKVLVYGGSSSFGGLAIQYLSQAGYTVVTTSSPKNKDFVEKLGAAAVVDHTTEPDAVVKELVAQGPYDVVADTISFGHTVAAMGRVLEAQGGGKLYTTQPPFGPEEIPDGVERIFEPWTSAVDEEKNRGLKEWLLQTLLPQGVACGVITPLPAETVGGGLEGINEALDRMQKGISGYRLVVDPWA